MKFSAQALAASALTASLAQAEDVLYSRRLAKRGIDSEGNYNICGFERNGS